MSRPWPELTITRKGDWQVESSNVRESRANCRGSRQIASAPAEVVFLETAHEDQDQQDNDNHAEAAAAVIASAIEWSAANAAEAAEQDEHKNNKYDRSNRHSAFPSKYFAASTAILETGIARSLTI